VEGLEDSIFSLQLLSEQLSPLLGWLLSFHRRVQNALNKSLRTIWYLQERFYHSYGLFDSLETELS
jgi:hypothetical protein